MWDNAKTPEERAVEQFFQHVADEVHGLFFPPAQAHERNMARLREQIDCAIERQCDRKAEAEKETAAERFRFIRDDPRLQDKEAGPPDTRAKVNWTWETVTDPDTGDVLEGWLHDNLQPIWPVSILEADTPEERIPCRYLELAMIHDWTDDHFGRARGKLLDGFDLPEDIKRRPDHEYYVSLYSPGGALGVADEDRRREIDRALADVKADLAARGLPRREDGKVDSTKQAVAPGASQITVSTNEFDAFLCHASEDKEAIVVPFADAMKRAGLKPWLDEGQVTWGDVLIHKIQNGLSRSRFVVVFISPAFLGKGWPEKELDAALSKEMGRRKVVLPIFLGLTHAEVEGKYPMVASKIYKKVPEYASGKRVSKQVIAAMVDELKAFIS